MKFIDQVAITAKITPNTFLVRVFSGQCTGMWTSCSSPRGFLVLCFSTCVIWRLLPKWKKLTSISGHSHCNKTLEGLSLKIICEVKVLQTKDQMLFGSVCGTHRLIHRRHSVKSVVATLWFHYTRNSHARRSNGNFSALKRRHWLISTFLTTNVFCHRSLSARFLYSSQRSTCSPR